MADRPLPLDILRRWMDNPDLEVLGAVWLGFISTTLHEAQPPLPEGDRENFRFYYFGRCLEEDAGTCRAHTRVAAARNVTRWFWDEEIFKDHGIDLGRTKDWLADIYATADSSLRRVIEQEILQRIFETDRWREFFLDWRTSPVLRDVYSRTVGVGQAASHESTIQDRIALTCSGEPIAPGYFQELIHNDSIDVMGAVEEWLFSNPNVELPIACEDAEEFYFRYYERCLKEDPNIKYGCSRYDAAHEVFGWYWHFPEDGDLGFWKKTEEWLRRIYLEGDAEVHEAIVTGALEHILQDPRWRGIFNAWLDVPELKAAYDAAMQWATQHEKYRDV